MLPDRILVVDDDLSMRQMLSILLERSGYTVDTAASAEEALLKIDEKWPDLVMTDLNMPGMHGIELLTEVKRLGAVSERDEGPRYSTATPSLLTPAGFSRFLPLWAPG